MFQLILTFFLIKILSSQNVYPQTPIEFRGLWSISGWNNQQQNYSQQLGQAFFYNNGTFTLNFLNNMNFTWINHFIEIQKTDQEGTYRVLTDTTQGPQVYINKTLCFWRRQISNGDILWGVQSNGTCTPSFQIDQSTQSTRYTRHAFNSQYIDDENPTIKLSNTPFEPELIRFDRSISKETEQSIVFYGSSSIRMWKTLEKDFANLRYKVINRGFGGSTLEQCFEQFKRIVLPLNPRLLVLYAGENDITINRTANTIQKTFHQMISQIRRFFPSIPIVYISIKPSPSRLNQLYEQNQTNHFIRKDIESMSNIFYLDVFTQTLTNDYKPRPELFIEDNLHLNEKGYAIWVEALQDYFHKNGLISKGLISCQLSFGILFLYFLILLNI